MKKIIKILTVSVATTLLFSNVAFADKYPPILHPVSVIISPIEQIPDIVVED